MPETFRPNWLPPKRERERLYDRYGRNQASKSFYHSRAWQDLRGLQLALYPLCSDCGHVATEVHHVIPIATAPDQALLLGNLESTCRPCHNMKRKATNG